MRLNPTENLVLAYLIMSCTLSDLLTDIFVPFLFMKFSDLAVLIIQHHILPFKDFVKRIFEIVYAAKLLRPLLREAKKRRKKERTKEREKKRERKKEKGRNK